MLGVGVGVNEHRETWNDTSGPIKEKCFDAVPYTICKWPM